MKNTNVTLKQIMENHTKLSLKKICDETGLCYQYIFKASKQPIEGQPYDSKAINFDNVQKIIDKKEINLGDYDWTAIEESIKVVAPINKPEDFQVETMFKLRNDEADYRTVYITDTHIVFLSLEGTQPRVMNWDTFLHQSPRIYTEV